MEEKELELDENEIENEEEESYIEYSITNYPGYFTLSECSRRYSPNEKVFEVPDFQRNPVWKPEQQSKLIESFLIGLPVPPIFLYTENGSKFKIIDGLQRIHAIYSFLNNQFKLKGLNEKSPYLNKTIDMLEREDRVRLENTQITATIIRQTQPQDDSSIYLIFERLNTGGTKLNNMEVRRCIAYGPFLETLQNINKNEKWLKVLGTTKTNNRFLDVELILRIFALYETDYLSPMKAFLNMYIENNKNKVKDDVAKKFTEAIDLVHTELGDNPFKLSGAKANYSLLDSVVVAMMKQKNISDIKEKFENLKRDIDFEKHYRAGQGTLATKAVKERILLAEKYFK
jgi:uncharacterized protein with ParB-like and HNH nuclease domain